jgi:hypothetical protein
MATVVSGWLSPLLLCASVLLLGRSFYVIYVRKIGTPVTVLTTWLALAFMVGFWTWYLALGGSDYIREAFAPNQA